MWNPRSVERQTEVILVVFTLSMASDSHFSSPVRVLRKLRTALLLSAVGALVAGLLPAPSAVAATTPQFVQSRTKQTRSGSTQSLAFSSANIAGNLIVVYVAWSNTGGVTLSDTRGNAYASATPRTTWGGTRSSQVFYANNIAGGSNTVKATFATPISSFADLYLHEYSGLDKSNPLDVTATAIGTESAMSSGTLTTTNANDLLFAAAASTGKVTSIESGYSGRTNSFGKRTMDRYVAATGSYTANATQNGTAWSMHLVAFKADLVLTDITAPNVAITAPTVGAQVADIVNVTADATDNIAVSGVQFLIDDANSGLEDTAEPYALAWDSRTVSNGAHTLTARARDAAGNTKLSVPIAVNVVNSDYFQNEVLATGLNLPTNIEFLPDNRMLVAELQGVIKVLAAPYTTPDPTPFLQIANIGSAGVQQGIYDITLDPDFANNHYYYVFYTLGSPNRDRLSRFTASPNLTGTLAGSETVLYQDPEDASSEHHGGAVNFAGDGRLFFTTGEHFDAAAAQSIASPRGKLHRINKDGTVPTDNPFYDGAGPNVDSLWATGLRNPFRAFYDAPTDRLLIGDVGGNDYSTAKEEVNLGARGANYGWPDFEGSCSSPCASPLYSYPHNGRDASITGGFVYHGTAFPASYQGSYFFADYTQNWIRRLTFDASGNVSGVFNFEPADGSVDGPYGDIVHLSEGPDGALYYVDLGYSDIGGTFGVSKIRRIKYVQSNQAPVAIASANTTSGPTPLDVTFSSAGSADPEGQPLTYAWTFGDGATSTQADPTHTYAAAGSFSARLSVSDGVNTTLSTPISVMAGNRPVATILSPADGAFFQAGDVVTFSGDGTDTEDGSLPASTYSWNIDFLHEGHVHPGTPVTGTKSGTFTIPTSGHDFSGNTRYRISLTVTDSNGLTSTQSVTIYPRKVNLAFDTVPSGRTLFLDGIAKTTPFVYDTLVGFSHTIEARDQTVGSTTYTFQSWSDSGAQQHSIVVPSTDQAFTATYSQSTAPVPIAFVQVNAATPQSPQSTVTTTYNQAQTPGNLNVIAVGWNESSGNVISVTDNAGNVYQQAVATYRGTGLSQAIYYAKNITGAGAGANRVTVTFDKAVVYADIRIMEYTGLDETNPLDVSSSFAGTASTATSGSATTSFARELIIGAGMTSGTFSSAGTGFTTRIITNPDSDIIEDRSTTTAGSYSANANQNGIWLMQMVTFRAPG